MIYEYYCAGCDFGWEEWRTVKERNDPAPCPECGKDGVRYISAASFTIKGYSEANGYSEYVGDKMHKSQHGKRGK